MREKDYEQCKVNGVGSLLWSLVSETYCLFGVRRSCATVAGCETAPIQTLNWPKEIGGCSVGSLISDT